MNSLARFCSFVFLLVVMTPFSARARAPLSFEERLRAHEAIERVYHTHRIWPTENPAPKPPFEGMVPQIVLETKAEDSLRMSLALESRWRRPITPARLQAEMDRMARDSKDPALLRELFAALGDDPTLIAECLARPQLAERSLRQAYAADPAFHDGARQRARAVARALEAGHPVPSDGEVQRLTFFRSDDGEGDLALPGGTPRPTLHIPLSSPEFEQRKVTMPRPGQPPAILENAQRVAVVRTLAAGDDSIEVQCWSFPKTSFESWWACEREVLHARRPASVSEAAYTLPRPGALLPCEDSWRALPENTPSPRSSHTMVWTGAEAIVWGGSDGAWRTNGGARYNPATDTWFSTSTASPCPSARDGHTAVWTGTEMVVWGGSDGAAYRQDGGRYNPLTDSWIALPTGGGCPMARASHTAVWTGSSMIVWGGFSGYNLNSGGIYSPSDESWTLTPAQAETPFARWGHAAVWTGTEMLVWGGYLGNGLFADSGALYDPAANLWKPTATGEGTPAPRREMAYVWTGSELVVWGGYDGGCVGSGGRYDPTTDTWNPVTSAGAPSARVAYTSAVWTGSEMVVWGGFCGFTMGGDGARYSPASDSWTPVSAQGAPAARRWQRSVWTGEEMILWGGQDGTVNLDTGGRYAPGSDSWVPTAVDTGSPSARERHTAVWTGAELMVWGGFVVDATGWRELETGGCYRPATDGWSATSVGPPCPTGRYAHSAVWTGSGILVWGGHRYANGMDLDVNSGALYDPASDSWKGITILSAPVPRNSHTSVWTGESMVVWGGYQVGGGYPYPLNDGGRYVPATDSWLPTSTGESCPSPRQVEGVWTGNELLIWGGGSLETQYGDGALYDPVGDSWRAIPHSPQTPSPRKGAWNVWTGSEFVVWGGKGFADPDGLYKKSGGVWNLASGEWRTTSTGDGCPAGRDFTVGIAPWSGSELLVWGGSNAMDYFQSGGRYNPRTDSWWPTATHLAPPPRNRHTTTWCGTNLIVFGGLGPSIYEGSGSVYTVRPLAVTCSATAAPEAGPAPLPVSFHADAAPSGCDGEATVRWTFGDGEASEDAEPTHTYAAPGSYAWTATVMVNGVACLSSGTVTVSPPCTLDCAAEVTPASGLAPLALQFSATAQGEDCAGSPTFAWDFGDGGTSSLQNPGHNYTDAGSYAWTLVVSQGGQTCTRTGSVTVLPPCTLECAATAAPSAGVAPLAVSFAAQSESTACAGSPSFQWNFGDGTPSAEQNPQHTYASPGSYAWTMTVSQDGQVCSREGTIVVEAPCALSCSASATPSAGAAPLEVAFAALSAASGCPGEPAFDWQFGDGGSSSLQEVHHIYSSPGTFAWSLTVTQGGTACSKSGTVTVTGGKPGDCDGDGSVSIGEVQKAINMFLGLIPPDCGVDCNGDGSVSIGEVQKVINGFLGLAAMC